MKDLNAVCERRGLRLPVLPVALPFMLAALAGCGDQRSPAAPVEREGRAVTTLTPALESVVSANDRLTWTLYRSLAAPGANLFLSPFSVNAALAMVSLGAEGDTKAELHAALGIPEPSAAFHEAFGSLLADLTGAHRGRGYQLYLANRLFGEKTVAFAAPFIQATTSFYRAPLQTVDYIADAEGARDLVNAWVSDNTQGAIDELVPLGVFDRNTRLALVNAIYFESSWATAFDPKNSKNGPFLLESGESRTVPLMHVTGRFRAAQDELFSMLSLDYADRELSMLVLLPQERGGLANVEAALDAERLRALSDALEEQELVVTLPRFEVRSELDLVPTLEALGVHTAFDPATANFSSMLEPSAQQPLYVSNVLHQSYVRVDEAGTTAAASTAVVVATRSVKPAFRADQPFVFAIRDNLTGALLFVGKIADPS